MSSARVVVGKAYNDLINNTEQVFGVKSVFYSSSGHPNINLLWAELNSSIRLTPSVRPICLPNASTVFTDQCYMLGEGDFSQDGKTYLEIILQNEKYAVVLQMMLRTLTRVLLY